ncbi:MAG: Alpha/Beta hydrolase protein [Linnemannia gamsii]|nr:MAG: Alpha/Beta hydrolase protein [Linnemannia gamsii]
MHFFVLLCSTNKSWPHSYLVAKNASFFPYWYKLWLTYFLASYSLYFQALLETLQHGTSATLGISRRSLLAAVSTAKILNVLKGDAFTMLLDKYTSLGVYVIHHSFTLAELFTISGLQLVSNTLTAGIRTAEESVRVVDGLFGSTETSKALAAVVGLVKKEVYEDQDFAITQAGKMAVLASITKAITVFACLQAATHKQTQKSVRTMLVYEGEPQEPNPANFPRDHLVRNIQRFMRYASASYGHNFMRILGIGTIGDSVYSPYGDHPNHHAFATHTSTPLDSILLSSFTDPGTKGTFHAPKMHSLVHYINLDHGAQCVVLTCRGTLGLSDVLTDLCAHYDDLVMPTVKSGKRRDVPAPSRYKVHAGMHASARLLSLETSTVYKTIQKALKDYPDYGLVLCGHSLGGGVAAILSLLWSMKSEEFEAYITTPFVTSPGSGLPAGRPIHCYAFGPPCVMSLPLSKYCAGLVTTVVHQYDLVPTLSLGLLRDFKNVATTLHEEGSVVEDISMPMYSEYDRWQLQEAEDRDWSWSLIKTMRADMSSDKLYPPTPVYHLESTATTLVSMRKFDHVEDRFGELQFARSMFTDHSPANYEECVERLTLAVFPPEE